jgi:hypothetical protein
VSRTVAIGRIAPDGTIELRAGDGYRKVEPSRTPLADIDPCPCGRPDCDRDEWHEIMNADPHGDVSWRESVEVSY